MPHHPRARSERLRRSIALTVAVLVTSLIAGTAGVAAADQPRRRRTLGYG